MVNIEHAWNLFITNAESALAANRPFHSPIKHSEYRLIAVEDERVIISREAREDNFTTLTKRGFTNAMSRLNANSGIIEKTMMYRGHVIIETTIVEMLPTILRWLDSAGYIVEVENSGGDDNNIVEARNDDPEERIARQIRSRRGQPMLRANLIKVYQSRCCVTRCNTIETLQACHLIPSVVSGDNDTSNAILLRADFHDLFDSHLLGIHPKDLTVHVDDYVKDEYYRSFQGVKLVERVDGNALSVAALEYRWSLFIKQSDDDF